VYLPKLTPDDSSIVICFSSRTVETVIAVAPA